MENQPAAPTNIQTSGSQPPVSSDDKNMALLAHLGGILFGFIPALIIWLVKKDDSHYVDVQAKEALNFQIFIAICSIISVILFIILIGVVLLLITWLINIIFCIIAGVKTANGENYRYPLSIRLIK